MTKQQEYNRAYYAANRAKCREKMLAYRVRNREKLSERRRARYVVNHEKILARQYAYYAANREKLLKRSRELRAANGEAARERRRAYYAANREKIRNQQHARQVVNREHIRERARKWREANREMLRERQNARWLARKYGITKARLEEMLISQGGRCAVCVEIFEYSARSRSPHVDHDHLTGQVRGMLCGRCNFAIGQLRDDAENCDRAAAYLRHHAALRESNAA